MPVQIWGSGISGLHTGAQMSRVIIIFMIFFLFGPVILFAHVSFHLFVRNELHKDLFGSM
jgi:hypothetical protein